jgi:AcrR family transcriptional regulator
VQIRAEGLESLSVGELMRSVNLTHGGFYGHFKSRAELVGAALERALQNSKSKSAVTGDATVKAAAIKPLAIMAVAGKDDGRRMIVIDPRRTEVADLADLHLAVRPGTDAFLLGALLAMIVARGGTDETFLKEPTTGWAEVRTAIETIPIDA